MSPVWNQDELEFLQTYWGSMAVPGISAKLGRSERAVHKKAWELGLGPWTWSRDGVSVTTLLQIVSGHRTGQYTRDKLQRAGLPVRAVRPAGKKVYYMVSLSSWWRWAEKHRGLLDFARFEPFSLGKEPGWVAHKRQIDQENAVLVPARSPWTPEEDARLKMLLARGGLSMEELIREMRRTDSAIRHRITALGLRLPAPLAARQGRRLEWTPEEDAQALAWLADGRSQYWVALHTGRTTYSIRARITKLYGTADQDRLREIYEERKAREAG